MCINKNDFVCFVCKGGIVWLHGVSLRLPRHTPWSVRRAWVTNKHVRSGKKSEDFVQDHPPWSLTWLPKKKSHVWRRRYIFFKPNHHFEGIQPLVFRGCITWVNYNPLAQGMEFPQPGQFFVMKVAKGTIVIFTNLDFSKIRRCQLLFTTIESLQFPWTKTWDIYMTFIWTTAKQVTPHKRNSKHLATKTFMFFFVSRKVETLNSTKSFWEPAAGMNCPPSKIIRKVGWNFRWAKTEVKLFFFHNLPSMKLTAKAPENRALERRFLLERTIFRVFS